MTKISKFIEFTPEQKERAATVDLEEFLLRQGERLIKSGREKRQALGHKQDGHENDVSYTQTMGG